jgi:hypothetical protein
MTTLLAARDPLFDIGVALVLFSGLVLFACWACWRGGRS